MGRFVAVMQMALVTRVFCAVAVIVSGTSVHVAYAESPALFSPMPGVSKASEMSTPESEVLTSLPTLAPIPDIAALPKALSASERRLYSEALLNYANISYVLHRDVLREALALQTHVSAFIMQPGDALYAQIRLGAARLYGAFLRTLYVYIDDDEYNSVRQRLLSPDASDVTIGAPYNVIFLEDFKGVIPSVPTQEEVIARRSPVAVSVPESEAVVYEGFGVLRALLELSPEMYVGYAPAPQVRRGWLRLMTQMIIDDIRVFPGAYRPGDDNTASRLLELPLQEAWRRITLHMVNVSEGIASGFRMYTPEAKRYGDATNLLSGIRAFVTGSYRHINGPGLAAMALSIDIDRAGFLNFSFSRLIDAAPAPDMSIERDNWRALAESLNLFK